MSSAHNYKKIENIVLNFFMKNFSRFVAALAGFYSRIMHQGRQRFTVMLIPHSEKKIFNFKISVFSLVFISFILSGIVLVFFVFSTQFSGLSQLLISKTEALKDNSASLEVMRDEVNELRKVSRDFESSLNSTFGVLGIDINSNKSDNNAGGDLASFYDIEEQAGGTLKEITDLQSLKTFLSDSGKSLEIVSDIFASQGDLLADLPTVWPVGSGIGRITNYFGPEIHPFTGQWYLHKGVDIASYRRGVLINAAANGKVVERMYDAMGFGNYVVVRHSYGYSTKYAHMDKVYVEEGDTVSQGQKLGTMGNTGLSTGQHLHFEVRIGSQVVDPLRFLDINSGIH
ncbi:MAG: M23 family metallopeptidase [Spirochaetia bacterium]|jgi:murein DD-endopeptidase MepM/ murein hydrolase activator NlpD|nr:M23 family metallopeptidase [Spirochaetia bacterium]